MRQNGTLTLVGCTRLSLVLLSSIALFHSLGLSFLLSFSGPVSLFDVTLPQRRAWWAAILITGGALETRGTLTVKEGPSSVQRTYAARHDSSLVVAVIITIFVALTVIRVTNAGNWFHYGHVEITTTVFIAVAVQGGTWNQFGSSRITTGSGRGT